MKRIILFVTIVITSYIFPLKQDSLAIKISKKEVTIKRIIDNNYFLSKDENIYVFKNIEMPNKINIKSNCHYKKINKKLRTFFLNKKIKLEQIIYSKENKNIFYFQNKNIEKYLLINGYAFVNTNKNSSKNNLKYEQEAQEEKRGIWQQECDNHSQYLRSWKEIKHKKSQEFFVSKIKTIFSDLSLKIKNKRVFLRDISFPKKETTKAEKCFLVESKKYLQNLFYDKELFIQKRYNSPTYDIFIPQKGIFPEILYINEKIIEDGYGKLSPEYIKNKHFSSNILKKQKDAYKYGKGAWGKCKNEILNLKKNY